MKILDSEKNLSVIGQESTLPETPGVGGERYSGRFLIYLDEIKSLVISKNPDANVDWIGRRKEQRHFGLPYSENGYHFLAINTPSTYEQGAVPTKEEPPIGMLRVVASAIQAGFEAGALDAHALNMSIDQIREQLEIIKPKIVGFNPTSVNVPEAKALAELCDSMGIPYILGGIHATLDPSIARIDFPNAVAIIRGDGELAILDVLNKISGSNQIDSETPTMLGVNYHRTDISTSLMHPYAPKMPIEDVPFFRQEELVQYPIVEQQINIKGVPTTVVEASLYCTRGCPFECGFCSSPVMVGRGEKGVRPYDHPGMERVVDEVEHMLSIGADAIHFLDDMVIVQPRDVEEFHRIVKERGLEGKFVWRGMTRAPVVSKDSFDERTAQMLVDSGCWRMTLGVESGNNDILKAIKKQITTEQVEIAVQKLVKAGVEVKCFFIMGFPGETLSQMQDTYNFVMKLKRMGLSSISIFQFKPYPGTALWNQVVSENPSAISRLDYIGGDARNISGGVRAIQGVYLPDDLEIADGIPSGVVRELVQKTLNDFFS